jgi:hypothetical protein
MQQEYAARTGAVKPFVKDLSDKPLDTERLRRYSGHMTKTPSKFTYKRLPEKYFPTFEVRLRATGELLGFVEKDESYVHAYTTAKRITWWPKSSTMTALGWSGSAWNETSRERAAEILMSARQRMAEARSALQP